jgi:hypothetical protein
MISPSPDNALGVLEVIGSPKYRLPIEGLFEFPSACPNTKSRALPRRQRDQSIIDRGVGCRSISQQSDIAGKRAGCHLDDVPVVSLHDLDVDRAGVDSSMSSTKVCTRVRFSRRATTISEVGFSGVKSWAGRAIGVEVRGWTLTSTVVVARVRPLSRSRVSWSRPCHAWSMSLRATTETLPSSVTKTTFRGANARRNAYHSGSEEGFAGENPSGAPGVDCCLDHAIG